ncbi:MAG TPA: hypothetical protein PLS23_07685 [Phycisphaerae bacterium]|nr:hypothetical protein [Phycisphaerae bacterium]
MRPFAFAASLRHSSAAVARIAASLLIVALPAGIPAALAADASRYFAIHVVDEQTGRGVPLVELQTTNNILLYTDSNGLIAFYEPGLMGQEVHFRIKSHGYEYPADGFGYRGVRLRCVEGGSATIKLKRINIAERLYRITGQGIYRDTLLLGRSAPITEPALNGQVMGSDSVMMTEYRGKLYWFWGDTNRPSYPLGNFYMTGATSKLPGKGGLDPDVGVDLTYFTRPDGFTAEMCRFNDKGGPTWADSFLVLRDDKGRERLYAAYANVNTKMEAQSRGMAVFNDEKQVFEKIADIPMDAPVWPGGHPFKLTVDGTEYVYFAHSLPFSRVKATAAAFTDLSQYEAFTCLEPGTRVADGRIDRDAAGKIRYGWKRNTPVVSPQDERKLVETGKLKADEALLQLQDADTGKPVLAHAASVYWNEYRQRWVLIVCEFYGTSLLGEIWYAEADTPLGPWCYARKVVTHDTYSFYNPKQHPQLAKENGRIIYFEGTYTHSFSGNPTQTPRYDYNQIMYKLDLDDPRMVLPVPVYVLGDPTEPAVFATARDLPGDRKARTIAFFAPDRPAPGLVAVCRDTARARPGAASDAIGGLLLVNSDTATSGKVVLFYALPADAKEPPATTVPLYEYTHSDGRKVWTTEEAWPGEGFTRAAKPVCRVWKSPTRLAYPLD